MVVMETHHRQYLIKLSSQENKVLKDLFKEVFGTSPPLNVSSEYLRGNIAWNHQVKQQGYKPEKLQQRLLKSLSQDLGSTKGSYLEGTRLFREWQGTTYEVCVLKKGFLFNNKNYRSLSKVAGEITGTRWSGPRFFGVVS